jgi:hypothetical protein
MCMSICKSISMAVHVSITCWFLWWWHVPILHCNTPSWNRIQIIQNTYRCSKQQQLVYLTIKSSSRPSIFGGLIVSASATRNKATHNKVKLLRCCNHNRTAVIEGITKVQSWSCNPTTFNYNWGPQMLMFRHSFTWAKIVIDYHRCSACQQKRPFLMPGPKKSSASK